MLSIVTDIPENVKQILFGVIGVIFLLYGSKKLFAFYIGYKSDQKRKSYPKDVVILHQFPRSKSKPSTSTPCLKLESWLKIAGIKYQNDYSYFDRSSQGQLPFVTLNGKDYHDSQFIIEELGALLKKDLSENLEKEQKSIARAVLKLLEESFKWAMYYHRAKHGSAADIGMPAPIFLIFKSIVTKAVTTQGYGRHTSEEVYKIGKQDLAALENILGNKNYLFGDNPCNEDAVLFAFISQLVYLDKGPFHKFLLAECPNLLRYFKAIKEKHWSDWVEN